MRGDDYLRPQVNAFSPRRRSAPVRRAPGGGTFTQDRSWIPAIPGPGRSVAMGRSSFPPRRSVPAPSPAGSSGGSAGRGEPSRKGWRRKRRVTCPERPTWNQEDGADRNSPACVSSGAVAYCGVRRRSSSWAAPRTERYSPRGTPFRTAPLGQRFRRVTSHLSSVTSSSSPWTLLARSVADAATAPAGSPRCRIVRVRS